MWTSINLRCPAACCAARSAPTETGKRLRENRQGVASLGVANVVANMDSLMKSRGWVFVLVFLSIPLLLTLVDCSRGYVDAAAEAPPPANIVPDVDLNLFTVDHPEQFPLAEATAHPTTSELVVTGAVTPDISRNVPVVSLASGRVVAIHARLGDTVQKGQLLLTIRSDDVAGGFDAYRKAVADELLARKQLNRAVDLYAHGAIAMAD